MAKARKKGPKKSAARKRWVPVAAPKDFNSQPIGETHVYDPREALGRHITVNLMTLTKNPKTQGINVSFVISGQHEGKLLTGLTGYRIMPSVVRRMVRRGKDKIEDSFTCSTSDKKKIRLKPLVVTRTKARGSTLTALRKELRSYLVRTAAKTPYEKFSNDVVAGRIQRGINETLSDLYPVVKCEIRWMKLVEGEAGAEAAEKEPAAEEKKEEK